MYEPTEAAENYMTCWLVHKLNKSDCSKGAATFLV